MAKFCTLVGQSRPAGHHARENDVQQLGEQQNRAERQHERLFRSKFSNTRTESADRREADSEGRREMEHRIDELAAQIGHALIAQRLIRLAKISLDLAPNAS